MRVFAIWGSTAGCFGSSFSFGISFSCVFFAWMMIHSDWCFWVEVVPLSCLYCWFFDDIMHAC